MWLTLGSVVLLVTADQLTKWWASTVLQAAGTLPFLPGIMQLTYIVNDGAAFSIFAGKQKMLIIFTAIALIVVLALLMLKKYPNGLVRWGLTLILGGGIGNLIDRVLNGVVVDFFEVTFMEYAIYNVADCFVVIGCVSLSVGVLFEEKIAARKAQRVATKQQSAASTRAEEPTVPVKSETPTEPAEAAKLAEDTPHE